MVPNLFCPNIPVRWTQVALHQQHPSCPNGCLFIVSITFSFSTICTTYSFLPQIFICFNKSVLSSLLIYISKITSVSPLHYHLSISVTAVNYLLLLAFSQFIEFFEPLVYSYISAVLTVYPLGLLLASFWLTISAINPTALYLFQPFTYLF